LASQWLIENLSDSPLEKGVSDSQREDKGGCFEERFPTSGNDKNEKNLNIKEFTQAEACGYPFLFFGIPNFEFV